MTLSASKCLLAAAALAGAALSFTASAACSKPEYPKQSLRLNEEGMTMLVFLIRADGTVGRSVVLESSVSTDLDRAAQTALAKCEFKPKTDHGQPIESWQPVIYGWSIDGDPEMTRAKQALALAADNGDPTALYRLSVVKSITAKSNADRQAAFVLLQSAADKGDELANERVRSGPLPF